MSTQPRIQHISEPRLGFRRSQRVAIGRAPVDVCSFEQAVAEIIAHAVAGGPPACVVTPNAQHIVALEKEPRLREIYTSADLVVPEGISLLLAARVLGASFPERVTGVDLFQALCGAAAQTGLRVFLLGGRPGAADITASILRERFPGLVIATHCPPLGFEQNQLELARVRRAITSFHPDLTFVALGLPKQEYWMFDHGRDLGIPVCVGVGGSFEMVSGIVPRAPRWIQQAGFEWLYRLAREPRRMWRRYLLGNLEFAWLILRQKFSAPEGDFAR